MPARLRAGGDYGAEAAAAVASAAAPALALERIVTSRGERVLSTVGQGHTRSCDAFGFGGGAVLELQGA